MEREKNPGARRKIKKVKGAQKKENGARKIVKKEQGVEKLKGAKGKTVKGAGSIDPLTLVTEARSFNASYAEIFSTELICHFGQLSPKRAE